MKMTLLDMVQEILSDMNSDNVNSISDTIEATQVATIIKRTFLNLHNNRTWPHTGSLFKIDASADSARPTHMSLQDDVSHIEWVKYDTKREYEDYLSYSDIPYREPKDFLDLVMSRDASADNAQIVFDYNGTFMIILNDVAPTCYTSFDDEHLVFDSYNQTIESTLQTSKIQVFGYKEPVWQMTDEFVPDMPTKVFPYLVSEAKSTAFLKVKEVFSQKDEQDSNRQKSWLSREKRRVAGGIKYPDYGRK